MAFAETEAIAGGLNCVALYTDVAMTENLSIYEDLGSSEVGRRTEDGDRQIYM